MCGNLASSSGSAINRSIGVYDFGGTQTVTSGTFTAVMDYMDTVDGELVPARS